MKQTARIGSVELGKVPCIVAIVDRRVPIEEIKKLPGRGAGLLEIRVDLFPEEAPVVLSYVRDLRECARIPLIGTVRQTDRNRTSRLPIITDLLPLVDAIDIEVDAPIRDEVVSRAKGKTVIVSEHDFGKTPDRPGLEAIAAAGVRVGAHITKIATMAHSSDDVVRLLRFCGEWEHPLVGIAMGEYGTISRVMGPLFGSLFSYGFLSDSVAPGQLSVDKLAEQFRLYYPGFGAGAP